MSNNLRAAVKAAFPHTIPVMTGYLFLGAAYGILMSGKGYGPLWILLIGVAVFAGSLQFVGIALLTSAFNPLYALLIALVVNARHLFYGVSMLEKFRDTGKFKPYLIYSLADETFSILCSAEAPPPVDKTLFMVAVSALHQCYWLIGGFLGGLLGPWLSFNTQGIDFVMTAFFVVIFINQWQAQKNHAPALTGVGASLVCLLLFGPENFIIPAMLLIVAVLSLLRKTSGKAEGAEQ